MCHQIEVYRASHNYSLCAVLCCSREKSRFRQGWSQAHIPHYSSQWDIHLTHMYTHTQTHTHKHFTSYLSQEQLRQKKITLSLTLKGQVDQSLTELFPSCPAIHSPHPVPSSHIAAYPFLFSLRWFYDSFVLICCYWHTIKNVFYLILCLDLTRKHWRISLWSLFVYLVKTFSMSLKVDLR